MARPALLSYPMIRFARLFLLALAAAFAVVAAAAPARAQQTAYAGGNPIVLSVPVTASVGGRCGFADGGAPSGSYRQENFDKQGLSNSFAFTLNCTGPSRVAVVSSNGGLVNNAAAPTGYTNRAAYDVTLNLVASDGRSTANATCAAATLTSAGGCAFRGPASTAQGLRLAASSVNQAGSYVRVSAPPASGGAQLVEGTYTDTLTITLSVAP
ncbi:MAG TPA: hypothetical protein VF552_05815 [Allosphingosinicella sp.]|jgi:hypothetical protein